MRMHHVLKLAGLVCVITRAASAACQLGAVAVLPVHEQASGFVFSAEVNGKQAKFILDTGFQATTLKLNSAERLGVTLSRVTGDSNGVRGVQHTYHGVARHMRVGNINGNGVELGGTDSSNIDTADQDWDGLFGMNMMASYDIDLDFAGQHVMLFQAEGNCSTPAVALAQPLYAVPLVDITHDTEPDVDIEIDGRAMRAVIDSGAVITTMFRSAATRLGVDLSPLHAPGHTMTRGIGPWPVASMIHVFDNLRIGNLTLHHVPVRIIDQAGMGINRVNVGSMLVDFADGEAGGEEILLGTDFMKKVHLWISHSSHRLIMQYPPKASQLPG